jgi:zinc transporter ZupT
MIIAIILGLCVLFAAVIVLLWKVDWKMRLTSPTVIASVVAASAAVAVAVTSAISGLISASYQSASEIEKTKANVLLSVLLHYDSSLVPDRNLQNERDRMKILIQSGIVSDDNGSICMALIKEGCPVQVLKAK